MDFIKKYTNWIIVILLVLFLCCNMKSCSKGRKITKLERVINQKDSIISSRDDSIKTLNFEIGVLNTQKEGMEKNLELQNSALDKISEAKKNINVTVRGNK